MKEKRKKTVLDNEMVLNDLDMSAWNYIQDFENLPEPGGYCRKCKKTIRVFSFRGGLCVKCYENEYLIKQARIKDRGF